jgi:hypothetical protein
MYKGVITEIESIKKPAKKEVNSNDSDPDYLNEISPVSIK